MFSRISTVRCVPSSSTYSHSKGSASCPLPMWRIVAARAASWHSGDSRSQAMRPVICSGVHRNSVQTAWLKRREMFALAIEDLRADCAHAGKHAEWAVFEAYDLAEGERPSYAELASRHGVAESSVTNYLAWARRRLRALVTERLRGVTSGERELREEMRRLWI